MGQMSATPLSGSWRAFEHVCQDTLLAKGVPLARAISWLVINTDASL
jgi:hypothetical protein